MADKLIKRLSVDDKESIYQSYQDLDSPSHIYRRHGANLVKRLSMAIVSAVLFSVLILLFVLIAVFIGLSLISWLSGLTLAVLFIIIIYFSLVTLNNHLNDYFTSLADELDADVDQYIQQQFKKI